MSPRTDHMLLMKEIEATMHDVFAEAKSAPPVMRIPFALVKNKVSGSPADQGGLRIGDKILRMAMILPFDGTWEDVEGVLSSYFGAMPKPLTSDAREQLDKTGVDLWNSSVDRKSGQESFEMVAKMRNAALLLIKASQTFPLTHLAASKLVTLTTKVGRAWFDALKFTRGAPCIKTISDGISAEACYTQAAQLMENESFGLLDAKASFILGVYQADLLWSINQSNVAFMLLNKAIGFITDNAIGYNEMEILVEVVSRCARNATDDSLRFQWLKKGLEALTKSDLRGKFASEAKVGNYDGAENAVDAVLPDATGLAALTAYYLKFAILKEQGRPIEEYNYVYQSMRKDVAILADSEAFIDMMVSFISILHIISEKSFELALQGADSIALGHDKMDTRLFEKISLTKIYFLASLDPETSSDEAVQQTKKLIEEITRSDLSNNTATVAQIALWRAGDRAANEFKSYKSGIAYYLMAIKLLSSSNPDDVKKY
ncbi:hypothetical protein HK101_008603, partial [Irineochytrium annulatum]